MEYAYMAILLRSLFIGLLLATLSSSTFAACTTGQTTCAIDTVADGAIIAAINDAQVKQRVYMLWLEQCVNVWSEAASTVGHSRRSDFCKQVASGGANKELLTAIIMSPLVQSEVTAAVLGTCAIPIGINSAAGCMVDADVNTAIGTALTVTVNAASTTATAATGSTTLVVASATGVAQGQGVYGAGIPGGAVVQNVSGTTVAINNPTTAALSATPVLFTISTGLP